MKPATPSSMIEITLDTIRREVPHQFTLLQACRSAGIEVPTLCFLDGMTPASACRICMVEVEGSRVLVPACSRQVERGMVVRTDSERVRLARRMVMEWGMSAKLGAVAIGIELAERHELSDALAAAVDEEVTGILNEACHCARQILATQRDVMDRVVARLKEVETVCARELDDMVATTNPLAVSAG